MFLCTIVQAINSGPRSIIISTLEWNPPLVPAFEIILDYL